MDIYEFVSSSVAIVVNCLHTDHKIAMPPRNECGFGIILVVALS